VFRYWKSRLGLRSCIAAAAAYALAFQMLLTGFAGSHPASDLPSSDFALLCQHSSGDTPGGAPAPSDETHCVLCTIAHGPYAVCGNDFERLLIRVGFLSHLVSPADDHPAASISANARYPRGPPSRLLT
jgi:hypothetical protein